MEENGKYLRLLGRIGLLFLVFIGALFVLIYGMKYFFGIVDSMSWFSLFFALFVICVPSLIFITVYIIYYNHTKGHPSKGVRIFSNIVFAIVLCSWSYFLVLDIILFSTKQYRDIEHYNTYNLAFLSANVGIIFFIGIVQALTTKKEVHWMDRDKE
jgi:hypothetical protein